MTPLRCAYFGLTAIVFFLCGSAATLCINGLITHNNRLLLVGSRVSLAALVISVAGVAVVDRALRD